MGTYFEATLHHEAALAVGQEHEAVGYIVSVVRKQGEMDAGVSWLSSFCSVRVPSPANRIVPPGSAITDVLRGTSLGCVS